MWERGMHLMVLELVCRVDGGSGGCMIWVWCMRYGFDSNEFEVVSLPFGQVLYRYASTTSACVYFPSSYTIVRPSYRSFIADVLRCCSRI